MNSQNMRTIHKNNWKHYRISLVNPTTKENATVEVWAFNEGQASLLGLRKAILLPCFVEKIEEIVKAIAS